MLTGCTAVYCARLVGPRPSFWFTIYRPCRLGPALHVFYCLEPVVALLHKALCLVKICAKGLARCSAVRCGWLVGKHPLFYVNWPYRPCRLGPGLPIFCWLDSVGVALFILEICVLTNCAQGLVRWCVFGLATVRVAQPGRAPSARILLARAGGSAAVARGKTRGEKFCASASPMRRCVLWAARRTTPRQHTPPCVWSSVLPCRLGPVLHEATR